MLRDRMALIIMLRSLGTSGIQNKVVVTILEEPYAVEQLSYSVPIIHWLPWHDIHISQLLDTLTYAHSHIHWALIDIVAELVQ
jgi:hypothetical protein